MLTGKGGTGLTRWLLRNAWLFFPLLGPTSGVPQELRREPYFRTSGTLLQSIIFSLPELQPPHPTQVSAGLCPALHPLSALHHLLDPGRLHSPTLHPLGSGLYDGCFFPFNNKLLLSPSCVSSTTLTPRDSVADEKSPCLRAAHRLARGRL